MEEIGVPITEARQSIELKKLPDSYVKLTQLRFKPEQVSLKHVVSRTVLPVFLPNVQEKINKAKTSTQKKLVFACNNIGKHVDQIWAYLKLILPHDINMPDSETFDFNKLFNESNYKTFKLISRFWVNELENVIGFIRNVFQRAIRSFTQISLAVIATQENGYAEKMGFYIATTSDVINNMGTSLKNTRECFEHFVGWFSERLDTLSWDMPKIQATRIVTSLYIDKSEIDLFANHKTWLQRALKTMFMPSLYSFYSQMYLFSLDFSTRISEWASTKMIEMDEMPAKPVFPESNSESVALFNDFTTVLEESRDYSKFDPKTDIYIISTSLYELYSQEEMSDEMIERLDNLMEKVVGYDMMTFIYLLHYTTKGVRLSIEDLSTIQTFIGDEILDLIREEDRLLNLRNTKRLDLKQYEKRYPPFSMDSLGYRTLENLFRTQADNLSSEDVIKQRQEILETEDFKPFENLNKADIAVFLNNVIELTRLELQIATVQKKKQEFQRKKAETSTQGYHELLKEQEKYEKLSQDAYARFLNAVSVHTNISVYDLENNDELKKALAGFRLWMETEGKNLYSSSGDTHKEFTPKLNRYFPFTKVAEDDAIHTELLNLIIETLTYHEIAYEIGKNASKSQMRIIEKRTFVSKWYYRGIIFGLFLIGILLWFLVPYFFRTQRTWVTKVQEVTGQAIGSVTGVLGSFLGSGPLVNFVSQTTRNVLTAFYLRHPTWDDINPYNIYLGVITGSSVGMYAGIFWWGGRKLALALHEWIQVESSWRALLHVRSIDDSPELRWEDEAEVILDRRGQAQALVVKESVAMAQAFASAGAETRALVGRIIWEGLNTRYPGMLRLLSRRRNVPLVVAQDADVRLIEAANSDAFIPQNREIEGVQRQYVRQAIIQNSNYRPQRQQQTPLALPPSSGPTVTILDDDDAYT